MGGQNDSAQNHVAALICPNSLAKGRYIMRHSGIAFDERELRGEYAMPKLAIGPSLKLRMMRNFHNGRSALVKRAAE